MTSGMAKSLRPTLSKLPQTLNDDNNDSISSDDNDHDHDNDDHWMILKTVVVCMPARAKCVWCM